MYTGIKELQNNHGFLVTQRAYEHGQGGMFAGGTGCIKKHWVVTVSGKSSLDLDPRTS